ncbi:MAG: single-stranded-DNA-specific exonuclease RecJ [Gemmatimonadota bacterium]|nr:single-stranded-DNA-specific exonuclease RecJ [Gemmatimonadota bacterium]
MTATAPRTRPACRWVFPAAQDPAVVSRLASELLLPEPVCRLLVARGHATPDAARRFLRPRLDQLHDPVLMLELERAVERVTRALREGETIMVHGDYDVDGICATTLLTRALRGMGGRVIPFIPHRVTDGYDLGSAGVDAALAAGARVVITADCGTSAHEQVQRLQSAGVDVIVTDHHLPGGELPPALAVLNAKRPGCAYPDKDLAAVGVAFKLALAVARGIGANENPILGMLDLVALATIADVAPLRGENRVLTRYGLRLLNETQNIGLRALMRASGLDAKPLTAGRVGFILAPRLNAAGRLGHALRGVELLLVRDEHEANVIARELEELNRRRQGEDQRTVERARELVAALNLDATSGIVLAEEGWHPGVIGIAASRIVEEFGRPTILIALDGAEGKGSGRSISAFDLHAALGESRDLLLRYGGHRAAAGLTIARGRVDDFAARFNAIARQRLEPDDLVPELHIDLEVALDDLTPDFEALLRHLEPCGIGNPAPVLVARQVRLATPPQLVGRTGLKLRLARTRGEFIVIGWDMAPRAAEFNMAQRFDIAFRLERDEWNGESRLQGRLADFRP